MVNGKKKFFIIAFVIFYLLQWLAPNKPIYFASYGVLVFFFYLATKNLNRSLAYTLILSIFSETSIAASLFKLDPDIISGYFISPFTIVSLALLFITIRQNINLIRNADFLAVGFLFWNFILFLLRPHPNSLFGIMTLGEITLAYLLLRNILQKRDLYYIPYLLSSILIFQTLVGLVQFITGGNVGILAESINIDFPYGLTASEEEVLYRVSGIATHANTFAMFLMIAIPYAYFFRHVLSKVLIITWSVVLFLTYSRLAWVIGFFEIIALSLMHFRVRMVTKLSLLILTVLSIMLVIIVSPLLLIRLETIPEALEENGSLGIRIKTYQEAWHQLSQFPILGVGLNMYLKNFVEDPVTDLFKFGQVSPYQKIHNFFLEVATESGIVGFLIFLGFILGVWKSANQIKSENKKFQKIIGYTKIAFISYLAFVMFHPVFLTPQMRIIYLLSAIMLIR